KVPGSARCAIGPAGAVPAQARGLAPSELQVRGHDALRNAPGIPGVHAHAAEPNPQIVLQSEPAHRSAAYPVETQRPAGGAATPVLGGDPQPRARNHATGNRREESEDACRVDVEPSRLRRETCPGARRRRAVPARRGRPAAAADWWRSARDET